MKSNTSFAHHGHRSRQRGFGMALAIAVLAVFGVIAGVVSFSNRSGSASAGGENARAMAQTVGVVATGLTQLTCQHINKMVNAAALDTAPPEVDTSTAIKEGCSTTTGPAYAYCKMLG